MVLFFVRILIVMLWVFNVVMVGVVVLCGGLRKVIYFSNVNFDLFVMVYWFCLGGIFLYVIVMIWKLLVLRFFVSCCVFWRWFVFSGLVLLLFM